MSRPLTSIRHVSLPGTPRDVAACDLDLMLRRLGGDEELCAEVIRLFVSDCPARLAHLRAAIDRGAVEELRVAAHALKGMAGNVAAGRLEEALTAIECDAFAGRMTDARHAWPSLADEAAAVMEQLHQLDVSATMECA